MINRALREVFSNFVRISFEGTWRGIFEPSESNFLTIAGMSVYCKKIFSKYLAISLLSFYQQKESESARYYCMPIDSPTFSKLFFSQNAKLQNSSPYHHI